MSSKKQQMSLFVHVFLFSVSIFVFENAQARNLSLATSLRVSQAPSAFYSFGDSFVDPGNNDYIQTVVKSNSPPYGKDYPGGAKTTGRFSNGLLFPDLLAHEFLKLNTKDQIPFLKDGLNLKERQPAISFASAGSGYDPDTAQKNNAISMAQQLDYFRTYSKKLQEKVGRSKANDQINEAVFYVSFGSDDFIFNYFCNANNPPTEKLFEDYQSMVLDKKKQYILDLKQEGAQRIAVTGLPPLGFFPIAITKFSQTAKSNKGGPRKCLEEVNGYIELLNAALRDELYEMDHKSKDLNIAYINLYDAIHDAIQNPKQGGFDEVNKGCCGLGFTEMGSSCNKDCALCDDANKYVFWDVGHPTQKIYQMLLTYDDNVEAIAKLNGDDKF